MFKPPPGTKLDTRRPFRAKDALAAGITRRHLVSSAYRRIIRGVYIDASVSHEPWHEALAVMLVTGRYAFVSHHTAARLYGATVPDSSELHASIGDDQHRSRMVGVRVHRSTRTPTTFRRVRVTTPEDTFLDLADHLDLVDLVVLGDSLLKKKRTTPEALEEAASAMTHGDRRTAMRAAGLVRAGVDSPMETRLRLLMVLAGLPEPEVNIVLRDRDGFVVRRIDMGYRAALAGLEYDGRQHAESRTQYATDIRRREELGFQDWHLWTAISDDIFRTPGATLERIVAFLSKYDVEVPKKLRDEWRIHFRGRE